MKTYNIIQVGSFDVENYGDLLFPIVLKHELEKHLKIKNLFLFSPNGGSVPFFGGKVYPLEHLEQFCSEYHVDAIILGGGDTIRIDSNVTSGYQKTRRAAIQMWQYPILVAQKYNIPVLFNAPGAPFPFDELKKVVSDTLEMTDYLSVRDVKSQELLESIGVKATVVMDTINIINDEIYPKASLEATAIALKERESLNHYIVFQSNCGQIDNKQYVKSCVKTIKIINKKFKRSVVLSPIGYVHNDLQQLEIIYKTAQENSCDVTIIREKMTPEEMLALFSHADGFIGTSLHGIITSNIYHVPVIAINPSSYRKVTGYMELCGLENRIVYDIEKIPKTVKKELLRDTDYNLLEKHKAKIYQHFDKLAEIIKQSSHSNKNNLLTMIEDFYAEYDQKTA